MSNELLGPRHIYISTKNIRERTYILNKKVKEISENHGTKEHQSKQLFNFIYLFRYIPSVEKDASFSLLTLIPLLWHYVNELGGQSHFSQKTCPQSILSFDVKQMNKL